MASKESMKDVFKKLEYLSVVSKVLTDMQSNLGFEDRVLAEFIIEIGRNCETLEEFDARLKNENGGGGHCGGGLPDYLVRSWFAIIHAILPRSKSGTESKKENSEQEVELLEKHEASDTKKKQRGRHRDRIVEGHGERNKRRRHGERDEDVRRDTSYI